MASPRKFNYQQICDIWTSLITESTKTIADHYGVGQYTISAIINGSTYEDFTDRVDPAIVEAAKKALANRRTRKPKFVKRRLNVPQRDTLMEMLIIHKTQVAVAEMFYVDASTMQQWCRILKIQRHDYRPGSKHHGLVIDDIQLIRDLAKEISVYCVAEKFEVSVDVICDVVCRKIWRMV